LNRFLTRCCIFAQIFYLMKVFKFGGASVNSVERIENTGKLLLAYANEPLMIIISAMGKTTNALEKVVDAFFAGEKEAALQLFGVIKNDHQQLAQTLGCAIAAQLNDFSTEIEWLLYDKPVRGYDYYYDQIVCVGELYSTCIISHYLNSIGFKNTWIDVRDVIQTDDTFRDAKIDWAATANKVTNLITPLLEQNGKVITQGFIGATTENESTTLGREGSDYTAAVFANMLDAESQTIWKDVPGVMNADPKQYANAQLIPQLSYTEVIEMAYYGAQVIHPKTIKPLQNKNIPLYVQSFLDAGVPGTLIHSKTIANLPPIIVYKYGQVMMQLSSKDFSFVSEGATGALYNLFNEFKVQPNLTQNGAISLLCVFDNHPEKIAQLAHAADARFQVQLTPDLTLLTIRHYTPQMIAELCSGGTIILQQQTTETIQVLMK